MTCKTIKTKLQDHLDQTLTAREAAELGRHLSACASCSKEYQALQWIVRSLASLPDAAPGAEFNDRVLGALGIMPAPETLPQWARWSIGSIASLTACWIAGLALLISSRMNFWNVLSATALAADPSRALFLLKVRLAESVWTLGDFLTACRSWGSFVEFDTAHLALRWGAATMITAWFMAAASNESAVKAR